MSRDLAFSKDSPERLGSMSLFHNSIVLKHEASAVSLYTYIPLAWPAASSWPHLPAGFFSLTSTATSFPMSNTVSFMLTAGT
jgi:hypothetical protein